MSETQIITLSAMALYFIAMIVIGFIASRDQTHHGFVIGSRKVGYIPTIGSLATSFRDGFGVIFWFGFGAATGYGGLWLFMGAILGLLVYVVVGPRIRNLAEQNNYVTIGEMLRAKYGVISERSTAIIIIFFSLMYIAAQLYVAGNLFSSVLDIEPWVGVLSVSVVVGFYLFSGGYSTVVKTDAIQFFLIIALIATPFFLPPPKEAIMNFSSVGSLGLESSLGLFLIGIFYVLGGADTWQRVFSARDAKVIRYSFPAAGVFLVIMTLSLIFLGMACAPYLGDGIGESDAFYQIFKGDFAPPYLQAFIAVVVMAICMSTLDTFCYLTAATLAKNFMPERVTGSRDNYIRFSQIVMVLILVCMSVMALSISDVIKFVFDAASLLFVLAPVYVFAAFGWPKLKNRKTDALVTIGLVLSTAIYLYLFTHGAFENLLMISVPAGCSIVFTGLAIFVGKAIKT